MLSVVLPILIVQISQLSCSAFVGDINNRRHQPLATTFHACDEFRCRFQDRLVDNEHEEVFASTKTRTVRGRGIRPRRTMATSTTTTTSTQLQLHPTIGASLAVVGSSLFGMQISRLVPSGGILGTLISAAFFGNVCTRWIPNQHPLYDLCFSLFLPGSLTLLLLAYRPPKSNDGIEESVEAVDDQNSISACIHRIAVPFLITSLASLLGCWLSYWCALTFGWFQECAGAGAAAAASIEKARELARVTTGCMSASYVGGSVNFMSTARIVRAPADLLGSLVTADLFTMAIYFSFLSSSLDWEWLRSKFATAGATEQTNETILIETNETLESATKSESANGAESCSESPTLKSFFFTSIPLLTSTFFVVQLANRVEDVVGRFIPGSACAVIAVVAPLLNSLVQAKEFWTPFSSAASVWSDFFFLSFFASIGVAANLSSALSIGPACLLFSTIALTVHVLGTVFGCILWKKLMAMLTRGGSSTPSLDLEDVWIASNAAIGGPATAAAFCGRMKKRDPKKLQGRTISATVWGVVGYAIGTIVGVSMYRMV